MTNQRGLFKDYEKEFALSRDILAAMSQFWLYSNNAITIAKKLLYIEQLCVKFPAIRIFHICKRPFIEITLPSTKGFFLESPVSVLS